MVTLTIQAGFIALTNYIRNGYSSRMPMLPRLPLTPAVFYILLALSTEERHGYGIMKQIEADSQGSIKMGPGTLYGSLKRMLDAGLVKERERRVDPHMDTERRIYYEITAIGVEVLAADLQRYQHLVNLAQERKLFPKTLAHGA
jgi:DNA-binding PadR family transcriptional regulator